ncbi:MAG: nuclear transport factor 2 family protein [Actinomycetota bacterium]|nr:nuclear transport factor 2 family protein [Actinomycetota bacterium]
MTLNTNLITSFYDAFERRDHAGMNACYHPDIHFSDPVFTDLHGSEVKAMWHMLCQRGAGLDVTFRDVHADGDTGRAHWEARYTLSKGGNEIHNVVDASFEFRDGLIIRHRDEFDLYAWTRMALGSIGTLLGWSPPIQNKVRTTAGDNLRRFIAEHPEYEQ